MQKLKMPEQGWKPDQKRLFCGIIPFVSLSSFELSAQPVWVVLVLQRRNECQCVITFEGSQICTTTYT